ncbi:MAG TPA: T9SS type A sorting domain-containing protein, partial [Bacteroidetes bacterium]|nr:T9SS type A sorting domain-containing protein [Bacteroidota bacterium]
VLDIYDIMGRKLQSNSYTFDAGIQLFQINLTNLASGVYTVVLRTEKSSYPQKIIIAK